MKIAEITVMAGQMMIPIFGIIVFANLLLTLIIPTDFFGVDFRNDARADANERHNGMVCMIKTSAEDSPLIFGKNHEFFFESVGSEQGSEGGVADSDSKVHGPEVPPGVAGTLRKNNGYSVAGILAIPEPSSMLLLGFGLIGIAGLKRRFKEKSEAR